MLGAPRREPTGHETREAAGDPPWPSITYPANALDASRKQPASSAPPKIMEATQSTVPYGDSSGERYQPRSSPPLRPVLEERATHSTWEDRTLDPNETGAVNFGLIPHLFSQLSQDNLAEPDHDDVGAPEVQDAPPTVPRIQQQQWEPETPVVPHNPFKSHPAVTAQVLGGSQLFRQTQFSSAVKNFSPTSSRPSPHLFGNDISSNPAVSSPLKNHSKLPTSPVNNLSKPPTSPTSPAFVTSDHGPSSEINIPGTPSKHPEPPSEPPSRKDVAVPQSPPAASAPSPSAHEEAPPAAMPVPSSDVPLSEDDFSSDEELRLRRHARLKKERAMKQLSAINIRRPREESVVEVPSTSRKRAAGQEHRRRLRRFRISSSAEEEPDVVADSQDPLMRAREPSVDLGSDVRSQDFGRIPNSDYRPEGAWTTPMHAQPNQLQIGNTTIDRNGVPETSPLPGPSVAAAQSPAKMPAPVPSSVDVMECTTGETADDEPVVPDTTHQPPELPPPAHNTRAKSRALISKPGDGFGNPRASIQIPVPVLSTSSVVSEPASTPQISSRPTTPATRETRSTTSAPGSKSPGAKRSRIRNNGDRRARLPALSVVNHAVNAPTTRRTRKSTSYADQSTDELVYTPDGLACTPNEPQPDGKENALQLPKAHGKAVSASETAYGFREKLFQGMAFAISFQMRQASETQAQYNDRTAYAQSLERKIEQAGGRILTKGFDALFEAVTLSNAPQGDATLKLTASARNTGFVALIADGYSRKAKYMQALALGLPCIHHRWVNDCLARNELLPWAPRYLLCAGTSSYLDDAAVVGGSSLRLLSHPYSAATARLADVVANRPRLLDGHDILVVMRRSRVDEERKAPYVFLVHVLGARLHRVATPEEARAKLREREREGAKPFDWVYVDESLASAATDAAIFGGAPSAVPGGTPGTDTAAEVAPKPRGRKRKKSAAASTVGPPAEPPPKRVRMLTDELVIQSLILGELLED